jgi:steroid 5-alpha reductase family enzyme
MMTILWIASIIVKNVSIVDMFWGVGFVLIGVFYFYICNDFTFRKILIVTFVTLWGLRLSIYLAWRNLGKGEDFRYQQFRKDYGEKRYWWISFFQTFLLQGVLMWIISLPLLGAFYNQSESVLNVFDYIAILFWIIAITFEAGGDFQLARFKANVQNKGKVLNTGLWKYTRHPNYFGDSAGFWIL